MSSANKDSFISSFTTRIPFIFFSGLIALARISTARGILALYLMLVDNSEFTLIFSGITICSKLTIIQ